MSVSQPRNMMSPNALSPSGNPETEVNPFEGEFMDAEEGDDDDEELDEVSELDFSTPTNPAEENSFAILNSSLPGDPHHSSTTSTSTSTSANTAVTAQHHLNTYASAKRTVPSAKKEKQHRTRWHFGIRSRSPPMEVMSAIYASLKALGMEWKAKKDLGGLCAFHSKAKGNESNNGGYGGGGRKVERKPEWDGAGGQPRIDLRAASSIYFVETRARQDDVVVLMNIQLYYVDGDNYLVDFLHKKSYRGSTDPSATSRFDMAKPIAPLGDNGGGSDTGSVLPQDPQAKEEHVISPYVFMDVACKLILDLAGGAEEGRS